MEDLKIHIAEFKRKHPGRAKGFEIGYENFKLGALLKMAREEAGLTQEQNRGHPRLNNLMFPSFSWLCT